MPCRKRQIAANLDGVSRGVSVPRHNTASQIAIHNVRAVQRRTISALDNLFISKEENDAGIFL
jgi:hypothetical protein